MRITSIGALNASIYSRQNVNSLSNALSRLSSGYRINSAKDDASSSAISNQLHTSANTLKQSQANACEAQAILQIADKAMDEQSKILELIKIKATQAAQDGQSAKTRKMIQADVKRLLEALDNIATTTSYNGMQLLNGSFINKKFQIGVQSQQVVQTSIGSTHSSKLGNTRFETGSNITNGNYGSIEVTLSSLLDGKKYKISHVEIGTKLNAGLGDLVSRINNLTDKTGIKANFDVRNIGTDSVTRGKTGADFSINGILIGAVNVQDNDRNGALCYAINSQKNLTGVEAGIDGSGRLELRSLDGRGIVLKDSTNGIFGTGHLRSSQSVQAQLKNFRPITANGVSINGENIPASSTPEALIANVNALTPKTGVLAKMENDAIVFTTLDQTKRLDMSGTQVKPNLGIPLTTVRGDWVNKTNFITRPAIQGHPEYNGIAIQVQKFGSTNKVYTERTILEGKADGKYYLQDIVDCFNKDSYKTGITAFVEDNPNNPDQQRICFTMPDDVEMITGMSTHNYPQGMQGPAGSAHNFGFGGSQNRRADGAKLTAISDNFGRLSFQGTGAKDIDIKVERNGVHIDGFLGMDRTMDGFSEQNISLQQMMGTLNTEQEEAMGFFPSIFDQSIEERDTLHLKRAMALMDVSENALLNLNQVRSEIGSAHQQLSATINNIAVTEVSLRAASSTLKDADFAAESADFAKAQVLSQSSTAMLYKAMKTKEQNILALLV